MYEKIKSTLDYGGLNLRNHIIFAPTTMGLTQNETKERMRRIASGGCALIVIGDVPVVPFCPEPSLYCGEGFGYYCELVDTIHSEGCKVSAQLYLTDSFYHSAENETELRRIPIDDLADYISVIPEGHLREYVKAFGNAAEKCLEAGFDAVQILGDRMLGSFSSAVFNKRTDSYGGSVENRLRLTVECVREVRSRFPELAIDFKLPVRQEEPHYGNAGIIVEELSQVVPMLETAGVTSFHVTLANHGSLNDVIPSARHPYFGEEGCFLRYADMVKKFTSLPVCGVGGLTDPDYIERQLEDGRIDCFAMSRQLITDPEWGNKVCAGDTGKIKRCIRCNGRCIQGMIKHSGVHCFQEEQ